LPWRPEAGSPPIPFVRGPWIFFDPVEGAAIEALVDRLIPPDPDTPGGKDAGCESSSIGSSPARMAAASASI
jgi:gluconate 2-dehydrogenase gamma chain